MRLGGVQSGSVPVLLLLLLSLACRGVPALEPITTGVSVGAALLTSAMFAGYNVLKCTFGECCESSVKPNITGLRTAMRARLHGQPLVEETVTRLLKRHLNNDDPEKALVLSFHGWTGSGKNFVSRMIAEHIYDHGMKSRYVNLFVSTVHFPHKYKVEEYQDNLRQWIRGNTSLCDRVMFIFDEMDKMPDGLLDAIKPYLDTYPDIDGVNYRKAIFVFLSNTAGHRINQRTLERWEQGLKREDVTRKEMEDLISLSSFNEQGGLWHSTLIEKNLISAFVPFLPLERRHVRKCVLDDLRVKGHHNVKGHLVDLVLDELKYFPPQKSVFSGSGCKRVSQKVDLIVEEAEDYR